MGSKTLATCAWITTMAVLLGAASRAVSASHYQVVHGWPELPEGFAFGEVSGIGVDSHNHVFVFHRGEHPVMCFDGATGKLLSFWGDGQFARPHGLTVGAHDNLWLTDVRHHQVYKFSHDGKLLMTVGVKDVSGLDGEHFNQPTDVAVMPSGDFYVSDGYGNSRVAKFSADGKFVFDWGRKGDQLGEFNLPHGIAVDAQGRVYVADRSNARVQVFEAGGKFLGQWKSPELGRPWDVAIGPDGSFFVMDGGDMKPAPPDRGRVLKLDPEGRVLETLGSFGRYDGQICWGHQVAVAKNGDVYVCDIKGMRAQKFTLW